MSNRGRWNLLVLTGLTCILGYFSLPSFIRFGPSETEKRMLPMVRVAKIIEKFANQQGIFPKDAEKVNEYLNGRSVLLKTQGYYSTPWGRKPLRVIQVPPDLLDKERAFLKYDLGVARNVSNPTCYLDLGALLYIPRENRNSAVIYMIEDWEGRACLLGPVSMRIWPIDKE